jgi:predicted outer membrane repeat protein
MRTFKVSLQRVSISGSVGRGALQASSVAGLLMLQCRVENNSADQAAGAVNIAGGGTFTDVRNLYLLETVFAFNVGPEAGAMLLQSCGAVVINSCTYHGNSANHSGGGVRAIASQSIIMDASTLQQPENISCIRADVLDVLYKQDFNLSSSGYGSVVCPRVVLGGRVTTFSSNVAGASGGAIAIDGLERGSGLTLAAFNGTQVNFLDNR